MCDSEWKDRLGFKMNYSSGEEETDRYIFFHILFISWWKCQSYYFARNLFLK